MRRIKLFGICIALGALLLGAALQAQVLGTIQGNVTDDSGAALPGVSVTARNNDTGATRSVQSNEVGFYAVRSLASGNYLVIAELDGMQSAQAENLKLFTGQTLDIDLQLGVEAVSEVITVTSESPLVETSRSSVASYVGELEIEALPIAGRDFIDFALLTPLVSTESTRGFIHIGGAKGIYTGLNIDGTAGKSAFFGYGRGGEATQNAGLVIAQDSVKEFQVVTSAFSPATGAHGGGYVNVVTKSGTNNLQGTAFFFARDEGLAEDLPSSPRDDARGIDGSASVSAFDRKNWGASIGGPIARDKTHFFFSYDQTQRDDPFSSDLNVPGLYDAVISRGSDFAPLVAGYSPNPDGTATGLFLTSTENLILFGKLDHQFNDSNNGSFRVNFTDFELTNNIPSGESLKAEETTSIVGSLVSVIGSNGVNEFRIQDGEDLLDRLSDLDGAPVASEVEVQGGGQRDDLGKAFFLPIFVTEEKLQIQDSFSYLFGDHDFKFGVEYQKDDLSQLFAGFKDGTYRFTSIDNFLNDNALFHLIFFGPIDNPNFDESQELFGLYAQDTWRASDNLTINYGFRYGETDNPGPFEHVFPEGRNIPDDDHIAPRFGFTYSPGDSGKDVIRGGAGLFFGRTPTLIFAGPIVQNGLFPNFGIVFSLFFFNGFVPFGDPIDNLNPPPGTPNEPNIVDPDFQDAEITRLNLGYEREIMPNWSAGVDVVYAEGDKLQTNIDGNLLNPTYDEFGRPIYSSTRANPDFGEIFTRVSIGESEYKAVTLKVNRRYSGRFQFQAHYTWSEDKDTDSDERSATTVGVSDITNLRYDYGRSIRDVENRFLFSGLVDLGAGFQLSGIVELRDGVPWTGTDDNFLQSSYCPHSNCPDVLGVIDGQLVARNSFRDESIQRVDVRLSKYFEFSDWEIKLFAEAFNLFNENSFSVSTGERQVTLSDGVTPNDEFGIADGLVTTPRQIQFGVRLSFD